MNNKITKGNFEENVILNSLGLLDKKDEEALKLSLNDCSNDDKDFIKEFNNLVTLISTSLTFSDKQVSPSPSVKEKLFQKIKSVESKASGKNKTGFEFVFGNSGEWMQHPEIKGISVKTLAVNEEKGYIMILMKAIAGAEYPSHRHSGAEECYVLEGDLFVEGKYLGPGDFHHAEGGSDHDPLRTKNGCTLILVVDPRDY